MLSSAATLAFAADPQVAAFVDAPDPVPAGGLVTYSARVDNNGADAALNTRLTVPVPAGAAFVSFSPPAANCVFTAPNVVCSLGSVAPGGSDVRNVDIVLRALGPGPTSISVTATVTADNDINPGNNSQSQTTTVVTGADLALTKTDAPDPVAGGAIVTYTLTVANAGPNIGQGMRIIDNLPPASTYVSATGSGWSCSNSGQTVTCTRPGPHAVGAAIPPVTIQARVTAAGGNITNSATVAPFDVGGVPPVADPTTSNNTATADTAVVAGADVSIAGKSVTSGLPAVAGTNVTFLIRPRNAGPAAATPATVTDVLPANWVFVSATGTNWSCSATGQTVTCSRASLPAGATDDITIVATAPTNAQVAPGGQTFTNTATISTPVPDPNASNNSGSVNVTVLRDGADTRITKTKTPNPVAQGAQLTSVLTVFNNGPRSATGPLRIVDQLPVGETYVSASGSGWTCGVSGRTVTCNHPNASGLAVGASLPAVTVLTTATTGGTLTNTACTGNSVPGGSGATPQPPVQGDPNPGNDCASASSSSTGAQPDLAITKTTSTASGDKVVSATEDAVVYTLLVRNLSATDAATGIRITDTPPAFINGRTPQPTATAVVSPGSTATLACTTSATTGALTCTQSGGTLQPGGTITVTFTVRRPMNSGSFTNTANVTSTTLGDPNPGNNSSQDTVTIAPIADVTMEGKTVTPNPVGAGQSATYVMSYRNLGPSIAQNITLTDTFAFPPGDAGVTVVSITAAGATCSIAAGAQLTPATPGFTCTRAQLTNNQAGTITLVVRPNFQTGNPARALPNTATITTTTAETTTGGNGGNNSRTAVLNVLPATLDVLVNKIDQTDPIGFQVAGTFIDYRVRATNNGPSLGTGVRVAESMQAPSGKRIQYVCDTTTFGGTTCRGPSTCSLAANTTSAPGGALNFTCQVPPGTATTGTAVGTLAAAQFKDIFLRFRVLDAPAPAGDVYVNTATVSANETDTFPGNNSISESTTVRQLIDLQTTKSSSAATVALNQPFNWTVVVRNAGPANSLATDLTDTLPASVQVTGPVSYVKTAPVGSGSCSVSGATVSCSMGPLNNAATATVTIPVRFTAFPGGGTATNSATVNTNPAVTGAIDSNPANNTGTSTVTVTRSSIAGLVFRDRNNDGLPGGPGESGIGAVAIALAGTDAYGNAITRNLTTAADGTYSFTDLPPSNAAGYTLTQTQPALYANGVNPPPASADSLGGTRPSIGQPGYGTVIAAIPVGANVAGINYTYAEVLRPSIGGTVFRDNNNNGVQNPGETGIAGATIELRRSADSTLVGTTTTDAGGAYLFGALNPDSYTIVELQPAGFLDGITTPGLIGGAPCAGCTVSITHDPANEAASISRILGVDVRNGDSATLMNFGELVPSTLAGSVFVDFNNNGTRQAAEPGIAGNALTLTGLDDRGNAVARALTTDASGNYSVGSLRPSNAAGYSLNQTQPAGFANGINPPSGQADSLGGTRPASGPGFGILIGAIPVAPNQNGVGYTFAELGAAAVSGLVWIDRNRDGTLQPGETGRIAGATVQLVEPASGAVVATVTTAADGSYAFANAPVGNYRIVLLPPAGYGTSTPTTLNVTITTTGLTGQNFGVTAGSVVGQVFVDANNNGTPQVGDTPVSGNTIELLNAGNAVIATTTSDAAGQWRFDDLPAATYSVRQPTQPPGTTNGITTAGSAGGTPTPLAVLPSAVTAIALPAATDATGYYFAEIQFSSLAGSVYNDANNNGVRDVGETGYAGQVLALTGTNDLGQVISNSATTDASGFYTFPNLRPGSYTIAQPNAPPGTLNGITSAGSVGGTATPVTVLPSAITGIVLPATTSASNYNFGELAPSSFSGSVYNDLNDNGLRDPGEPGFAAQSIVLTGTNDLGQPVSITTSTDASGNYVLGTLRPGTYTLTQPGQPAGTSNGITTAGSAGGTATPVATVPSAISGIALAPGTAASGYLFGERAAGSIAGSVYLDANNNGVRDPAEVGIAGQTLTLAGTDALGQTVSRSVVTDASGNFVFNALLAGTYAITQPAQPAGTLPGRTTAGTGGGSATAPTVAPSAITAIALPASGALSGNLFGELPGARLSGSVFNDVNNNGVRDSGETGFAANTLTLTGTDDLGQAVSRSVATDANGDYAFGDLRPGTYSLTQPAQPPGTVNGITAAGTLGGTATPITVLPSRISAIVVAPGANGTGYTFAEIGNSADIVGSKAAVGVFATGNDAGYRITVANVGQAATSAPYSVQDRLPTGMTLAATPTGSGWSCTGVVGDSQFLCTSSAVLAAAATAPVITVRVSVAAGAVASGTSVTLNNPVLAQGGGELPAYAPTPAELAGFNGNPAALPVCASGAPTQNACRTPTLVQQAAAVGGVVWYDTGSVPRQLDGGDLRLAGWTVQVLDAASGNVVRTLTSAADGSWRVADLLPATEYLLRFREPGAGVTWGVPVSGDTGTPPAPCVTSNPGFAQRSSCVDTTQNTQLRVVLLAGDNLLQQSLPVDPAGVVYDALTRNALPGAVVTLAPVGLCAGYDPAAHLANAQLGGYTLAGTAASMTTGALGAYQFLFNPAAPPNCTFGLTVAPPTGYGFVSQLLPPQPGTLMTPPAPGTTSVQPQAGPPPVGSATTYYLQLNSGSGTQSVINNHIPLDPASIGGIVIVKTGSVSVIELGDSLQYRIRIRNTTAVPLPSAYIDDQLPAGFRYIPGTAQVTRAGAIAKIGDPAGSPGPQLTFAVGALPANQDVELSYRVRVGVGAQQGNGVNTAQAKPTPATNCAATPAQCSNVAQFKVRVQGGVFTEEACLAGKVYVDCNGNRLQDEGEPGIPGVRLWLQSGTYFITDSEGRYSYCGLRPMAHVLKADKATLPDGSQLVESNNSNLGDAGSLLLEIKKGELHRGDFIEGSCTAPVLDQVRARRGQGEVGGPIAAPARAPTASGQPNNTGTLQFRSPPSTGLPPTPPGVPQSNAREVGSDPR